jgi:hypothetical protein
LKKQTWNEIGNGFKRKIFYYDFPVVSNQAKLIGDVNAHFVSVKGFGCVIDSTQLEPFWKRQKKRRTLLGK